MKKLLLTSLALFSFLSPVVVLAQTPGSTAYCQQLYGSTFVWNGANCVLGSGTTATPPAAVTPTSTTCPNGSAVSTTQGCGLGYTPLEPIPGLTEDSNALVQPNNLHNIINAIFKILITAGALLAVLSLTIGGVQYMVSGSAGGKNAGIKRAQAALWAILLIAGSWLILNTINPNLLNFSLNPCPQGGTTCSVTAAPSAQTPSVPTQITQLNTSQTGAFPAGTLLSTEAVTYDPAHPNNTVINQAAADCTAQKGVMVGAPLGVNGQSAEVCMNPSSPNFQLYNAGAALP